MRHTLSPWFTIELAAVITVGILLIDAIIWKHLGAEFTFSRAASWTFNTWPALAAVGLVWAGILIGHVLPK